MADLRKVEVRRGEEWVITRLRDLAVGDMFRLFESSGEPVLDKDGRDRWTVHAAPEEVVNENGDKTWAVYTEDHDA